MKATRLVFKFGDALPATNPVAVFVVALSSVFNDLLLTNMRMFGANDSGPEQYPVTEAERLYLLRVSFSQLHELRESIKHARKDPSVATFLGNLPEDAGRDLAMIEKVNPTRERWVGKAITHVRNQTVHYGGKWNWADQEWALTAVANEQGEIVITNGRLSGTRLSFADLVAVQHFTRMAPEYDKDPNSDPAPEILADRLRTLFTAAATSTTAAIRFIPAALNTYIDSLPNGTVVDVD